jgi:hypothetical protein
MKKLFYIFVLFIISCGTDVETTVGNFSHPYDLVFAKDIFTKIYGFTTNTGSGNISMFNAEDHVIYDTDDRIKNKQGLFIGGVIKYIDYIVDQSGAYKIILVCSLEYADNSYIALIGVNEDTEGILSFNFIESGDENIFSTSNAVFIDKSRTSNPTINDIIVDSEKINGNLFVIENKGDDYEVSFYDEQNIKTIFTKYAQEDVSYTSDNNEVSFLIKSGRNKTSKNDYFYFYTRKFKPFKFSERVSNLLVANNNIYLTSFKDNKATLFIYSYTSALNELAKITFDAQIEDMKFYSYNSKNLIFIANSQKINDKYYIYVIDVTDQTLENADISLIETADPTKAIVFDANSGLIYASKKDEYKIDIIDYATSTLIRTISTYDFINALELSPTLDSANISELSERGADNRAVLLASGLLGNLNFLDTLNIIDANVYPFLDMAEKKTTQSSASSVYFIDTGANSEPQMKNLVTKDTVTKNENWIVIYEDEPDSDYLVVGSISGVQVNKAKEGETYKSDNEEISFFIKASSVNKTSEGDYFIFDTYDGIEPLSIGQIPSVIKVLTTSDGNFAYTVNTGANSVSVIDLDDLSIERTLR